VISRLVISRLVQPLRTTPWIGLLAATMMGCATTQDPTADGPLRVTDAWVRVTNVNQSGAAYMTIENRDSGVVWISTVSTTSARAADMHETMRMDGAMAGMVHMTQLDSLSIAPGNRATLAPGGTHIMLTGLVRAFAEGDTLPLALTLTDGRTTDVRAIVRAQQP